jgi:hypothetical protein
MKKLWNDDKGNLIAVVSVAKIVDLCNPLEASIWETVDVPITKEEVIAVPENEMISEAYDSKLDWSERIEKYSRDWHIKRIAYLMRYGWTYPISLELWPETPWPVDDGNHRLMAAIFRGDSEIHASIGGYLEYANGIFEWYSPAYFKKLIKTFR